jgi:hypothetical protein
MDRTPEEQDRFVRDLERELADAKQACREAISILVDDKRDVAQVVLRHLRDAVRPRNVEVP